MSIGKITLKEKNGEVVYDVELRIFDVADTIYAFPGGALTTYEESLSMRQALQNARGYTTSYVQRVKNFHNTPRNNIRSLLQYQTGDTQETSLDYLESLWMHGVDPETIYTEFHY